MKNILIVFCFVVGFGFSKSNNTVCLPNTSKEVIVKLSFDKVKGGENSFFLVKQKDEPKKKKIPRILGVALIVVAVIIGNIYKANN